MPQTVEQTHARFAELLTEAMNAKGWSILDLAKALKITYEHTRRLVNGQSSPSPLLVEKVCRVLPINLKSAEEASTADKIQKHYGVLPQALTGRPEGIDALEAAWPHLTAEQQTDLTQMAKNWAKRNKAGKA